MKNQGVAESQLLPNVMTVPDGVGEIVSKQNQGWGYIKVVAHYDRRSLLLLLKRRRRVDD